MSQSKSKKLKSVEILNPNEEQKLKNVHQIHSLFFIIGILGILFVQNITKRVIYSTPDLTDKNLPFVGIDSWKDLKALNDIGPKVCGTPENEVMAVNYIKQRINHIISHANKAQRVELDHQIVSGTFHLEFNPGTTSVYRAVQNLVVKIEGESPNALLINCHFDTVIGSPGASDDTANCAIMLEILSVLSNRGVKNRNTIIFLFNGSEETILKAAHGFIAHHKWAKQAKVLINLESAGSGGREILFQSGPGNSWLINHYHAVRSPFAQVSSEEIFQSGIIPSDTDFRIFRDFGNIVGLDFAHFVQGYRYHTKYDHIDYLTIGNLQRTGENILELALSLSNSDDIDNYENFDKNDLAVYFDFLGIVLVNYTKEIGVIINYLVVIVSIVLAHISLRNATVNVHSKHIVKETFLGLISIIVGFAASLFVCYLNAYFLDKAGHAMSWFRNTYLAKGIYSSLTVWFLIFGYDVFDMVFGNKNSPLSLGLKVQARINGINILWGILTIGLTLYGIRSAYLFMVLLTFNLLSTLTISLLRLQNSVHKWLYVFMIGQVSITFWTCYFKTAVTEMFIPIVGRIGSKHNPDIMIAVIMCVTTLFVVSYFIPLTQLLKGKALKYLTIISIYLISILLATFTSLGFPYQDSSTGNPVVQRHHIWHTSRTFYDIDGNIRKSDNGVLFLEWDRNSLKVIEGITMPVQPLSVHEICDEEPFCGMPIVISRMVHFGIQWVPTSAKPRIIDAAKIDTHEKINLGQDLIKHEFSVNSTKLVAFYMRPRDNVELVSWSLTENPIVSHDRTYFVSIAAGVPKEAFKFDLTFKNKGVPRGQPIMDITLVTIRSDRQEDYTEEYKKIIKRFPSWTFPVTLLADIKAYQY